MNKFKDKTLVSLCSCRGWAGKDSMSVIRNDNGEVHHQLGSNPQWDDLLLAEQDAVAEWAWKSGSSTYDWVVKRQIGGNAYCFHSPAYAVIDMINFVWKSLERDGKTSDLQLKDLWNNPVDFIKKNYPQSKLMKHFK